MDPHLAWIEELATSNHMPSEAAVEEIKRMLIEPMKDLEIIDAEIQELQKRLSELDSKRTETEKRTSRLNTILSPIRRVPPDVLREIFYQCLPIDRNPILKSTDCPLLLTHVCSPWRAAAISSPRLWAQLYITFTDDDTVPDIEIAAEMARNEQITIPGWRHAQSKPEKQRRTEALRRRYDAVSEWLSRSGTRPLSLSLLFTSRLWYTVPYSERPHSITMEFLSFLATLFPRLKDLELHTSPGVYNALEQHVSVSKMTALTSLSIKFSPPPLATQDVAPIDPLSLFHAPNLRQLSVSANTSTVMGIHNASFLSPWGKLTKLSCVDTLTINETIFLLEHCSNLVHYEGRILEYIINHNVQPFVYDGHISLPFLKTFSITEYIKPQRLGNIYDRIYAPSLQSVYYFSYFYRYREEFLATNPVPIPILPLLRKSTDLEKLSVNTDNFTAWDLGLLLRAVPTITHLNIGIKDNLDCGVDISPSLLFIAADNPNSQLWSFKKLIVDHSSNEDVSLFLPRLKSLAIWNPTALINEDIIVDIIKSRMMPTTSIAALEQVKIKFPWKKTRDIDQEVADYAQPLGVKINLEIQYAQALNHSGKNPMSPAFGLFGPGMDLLDLDSEEYESEYM